MTVGVVAALDPDRPMMWTGSLANAPRARAKERVVKFVKSLVVKE